MGFRPFVKRLADQLRLLGRVSNNGSGVVIEIEIDGGREQAAAFVAALRSNAPEIARIDTVELEAVPASGTLTGFVIAASNIDDNAFTLIPPDIATCPDCLRDIGNPAGRHHGYPFTNCTNCGPRYSIVHRLPYDRANTTMAPFSLCALCAAEYEDPAERRFHAEPNACPLCGPKLSESVASMAAAIAAGEIVALKSLGGYQLACDAYSSGVVEKLRERKRRGNKPFAVMMRDIVTVRLHCFLHPEEEALLTGSAAPIVVLRLRPLLDLAPGVAPGLTEIGVMLPYTPLHHLLLQLTRPCLVMTSGNISEEPIVISNDEACESLGTLADRIVTHNRDIFTRVDDSVVRHCAGAPRLLRRARGYAPEPIDLGRENGEILACGGEMKNTFCLIKGRYAILSQHIGDIDNYETLAFYEETLDRLKTVYHCAPRLLAHDLHPDYLTTRWAERQPLPRLPVQHHHAHIASCMAENALDERVIGVAFDGTGYGSDGQIWGGEFLLCDYLGFERAAHLRPVPLIGGEQAMRDGFRMAAAYAFDAAGPGYRGLPLPADITSLPLAFDRLLQKPSLWTSSCGRLFDAVASLAGICQRNTYEGEAAMLLEAAIDAPVADGYPFTIDPGGVIDTRPMVRGILASIAAGASPATIAGMLHWTISAMIEAACRNIRETSGVNKVCLSGGVFQNSTVLAQSMDRLSAAGFAVFTHSRVPTNDGGLALGQATIAAATLAREES